MRKVLGYSLLIFSCIAFAALPLIPFLPIDTAQKAAWGGGLFIAAEVTWWLSLPLLGSEVKRLIGKLWRRIKTILAAEAHDSKQESAARQATNETSNS